MAARRGTELRISGSYKRRVFFDQHGEGMVGGEVLILIRAGLVAIEYHVSYNSHRFCGSLL